MGEKSETLSMTSTIMAAMDELRIPMESLTLGKDSHSSSFSHSESRSSGIHSRSSETQSKHDNSSGYLNDYTDIEASYCAHGRRNSLETVDTNLTVELDYSYLDKYSKLVEVERVPWGEQEILNILREGRTKDLSGHITVEIMQKLGFLLQRPLVRIATEVQRLSQTFCRCGRDEITAGMKVVLARSLADSSLQACHKATALYAMSGDTFKQSKSSRCGLRFSVGKFHRWMIDAGISLRIHEFAAIYLTACMENLLEEIVLLALSKEQLGDQPFSMEVLDFGISSNPELFGLLQPHEHLICGRTSNGILTLPLTLTLGKGGDPAKVKGRRHERGERDRDRANGPVVKNIEQSLLATCVGSLSELGDLVTKSLHYWYNKIPAPNNSTCKHHPLSWSATALHTLYYYMRCMQLEHADNPNITPPTVHLHCERPYAVLPPLVEWIRVATAHTEHRRGWAVDADDVRQAARLLLPGVDCPPRQFGLDDSLCVSRFLDAKKCAIKFQQDLAFQMLGCGRSDILPEALSLLGIDKVNTMNEQGLTPLMYACIQGDEAMVQMLIDAGAKLDIEVPSDLQKYPCVQADTKHWTALTFATVHNHLAIVQLLLERGANVEGSVQIGEDNYSETPLQLAAASGQYELVSLLLGKGADPYLNTIHKNGISYTYSRGGYSAFALAAAHGHRNVLRKLLSHPVGQRSDMLSLEEILAEGTTDTLKNKYNMMHKTHIHAELAQKLQEEAHRQIQKEEEEAMKKGELNMFDKDDHYVTIDEVLYEDNKLHSQTQHILPLHKLTKAQARSLQEALYHAAENGFLDIALELRNMGVPWSMHTWGQCLSASFNMRRKTIVQCLLKDFSSVRQEIYQNAFISEELPLMFDILKSSKNEVTGQQLAAIFTSLYGTDPIPSISEIKQPANARIDSRFVNNPELSDIQFLIEGKLFYAHKIILVNASNRFRAMLSSKFCEGKQNVVEINDVRFHIFEYIMRYLYHGTAENVKVASADIMELMAASNFFMLDGLQRHCEVLCSHKLTFENCIAIYRHAKLYNASELMAYCEGYFLHHLPALLGENEDFRRMIYSSKMKNYDLCHGLLMTITRRMDSEQQKVKKTPTKHPAPISR